MPSPIPAPPVDATSTRRGLMGIGTQAFSGLKTFLDAFILGKKTTDSLPSGGTELKGMMLYNTTTDRAMIHNGTEWIPVVMSTSGGSVTTLEEHLASTNAHNAYNLGYTDTTVGAQLEWLGLTKLSSNYLASDEGSTLVGTTASTVGPAPETFTAGTVRSQLDAVLGWVNARARKAANEVITGTWTFENAPVLPASTWTILAPYTQGNWTNYDSVSEVYLLDPQAKVNLNNELVMKGLLTDPTGDTSPNSVPIILPTNLRPAHSLTRNVVARSMGGGTDHMTVRIEIGSDGYISILDGQIASVYLKFIDLASFGPIPLD